MDERRYLESALSTCNGLVGKHVATIVERQRTTGWTAHRTLSHWPTFTTNGIACPAHLGINLSQLNN